MARVVGWVCLTVAVAGCQAQSPFEPFGPPTVPAPAVNDLPYYPPSGISSARGAPAAGTRQSVSVSGPSTLAPRLPFVAEAADREPIRIVENDASTRTADAGRTKKSSPLPTQQPVAPNSTSPSLPAIPPENHSGQTIHRDAAVRAASHEAARLGAIRESQPAAGQWRAR